jgi:hypothetical protein
MEPAIQKWSRPTRIAMILAASTATWALLIAGLHA